jgi:aspartate 4-decarboxylase
MILYKEICVLDTILTKEDLSKIYGRISPFEFKDKLIRVAKKNNERILL